MLDNVCHGFRNRCRSIVTPTLYIYIYAYSNEELCRIYVSWEIDYRQRKFCDFITLSLLTLLLEGQFGDQFAKIELLSGENRPQNEFKAQFVMLINFMRTLFSLLNTN